MTPHRVTLDGGPAAGEQVTATDPWVWVARCGGKTHVFDMTKPADAQRTLTPLDREQWVEYQRDPVNPTVYRYARSLPPRAH